VNVLTANDLKTKGVSVLEARLKVDDEVVISVRGKERYVVMALNTYAKLREHELMVALYEARADVAKGSCTIESVADHLKRVADEL